MRRVKVLASSPGQRGGGMLRLKSHKRRGRDSACGRCRACNLFVNLIISAVGFYSSAACSGMINWMCWTGYRIELRVGNRWRIANTLFRLID